MQDSGYCGGRWCGEEGVLTIEGQTEGFNSTGDVFFLRLGGGHSASRYVILCIFLSIDKIFTAHWLKECNKSHAEKNPHFSDVTKY